MIRVDADEDPHLAQAYAAFHDADRRFLESVTRIVPAVSAPK